MFNRLTLDRPGADGEDEPDGRLVSIHISATSASDAGDAIIHRSAFVGTEDAADGPDDGCAT